jgi:hypothetical protein
LPAWFTVTRGLYQLAEAVPDARRSFAEASALVPKGVIASYPRCSFTN